MRYTTKSMRFLELQSWRRHWNCLLLVSQPVKHCADESASHPSLPTAKLGWDDGGVGTRLEMYDRVVDGQRAGRTRNARRKISDHEH